MGFRTNSQKAKCGTSKKTNRKSTGFFLVGSFLLLSMVFLTFQLGAQHITEDEQLLERLKEASAKELVAAMRSWDAYDSQKFNMMISVIRMLGEKGKGSEAARNLLLSSLEQGRSRVVRMNNRRIEYWKIRAEAAIALGELGDKEATKHLVDAAHRDDDMMVRLMAIRALGTLKDKEAVPRLLDMLESTTIDRIANEIVVALGEIGDKRAFPLLLSVTQRNFSQTVRKNALKSIKKLQLGSK